MLEDNKSLLKKRQLLTDAENNNKWEIKASDVSGNGVFATKPIETGEIIFNEDPLIVGPRAVPVPVACVSCRQLAVVLSSCRGGCRLPVCGEACSAAPSHLPECSFLAARTRKEEDDSWAPTLYRALAPLRCLLLPQADKDIIRHLARNKASKLLEIGFLKKELEGGLSEEEETFLEVSCRALNAVAFEMQLTEEGGGVSWRGLYPLAGTMNHSCSPNTRHHFTEDCPPRMAMQACRPVAAGEELTAAYCPLLWATLPRRYFLQATKEFLCRCLRCSDPTEFGSYFSAEVCGWCGGYVVPMSGQDPASCWHCEDCRRTVSLKEVIADEAARLREGRPAHGGGHLAVQLNLDLIRTVGHKKKPYSDTSEEELESKLKAIKEVLKVNERLRLGESNLKGLMDAELKCTLQELRRRKDH